MAANTFEGKNAMQGDFSMLPSPIQGAIQRAKIVHGDSTSTYAGMKDIATVGEGSTDTITVRDSARFQPQVLAHEATHLWQNSLPESIRKQFPKDVASNPYFDPKDLLSSLSTMRDKGMKFENLPEEHQAQVVQAYTMYHDDKEYAKGLKPWMDDVTRLDNAAQLDRLLHKPVLPDSKSLVALYNSGQRGR